MATELLTLRFNHLQNKYSVLVSNRQHDGHGNISNARSIIAIFHKIYNAACPTRQVLTRISDKWTGLIIGALAEKPLRFNELRRTVGGISQKMLTQTLRSLEKDKLVLRSVKSTVPITVTYSLTPLGHSLNEPINEIRKWAIKHVKEMKV